MAAATALEEPEGPVQTFLKESRPDWKFKDVKRTEEKLHKVGIYTLDELLAAIHAKAELNLNARLKVAGERSFMSDTMIAFRRRAKEVMEGSAQPTATAQQTPGRGTGTAGAEGGLEDEVPGGAPPRPCPGMVEQALSNVLSLSDLVQASQEDLKAQCLERGIALDASESKGMLALLLKMDTRREQMQLLQEVPAA